MGARRYTITQTNSSEKGMGRSDTISLQRSFVASPFYDGTYTDEALTEAFQYVLTGVSSDGGRYGLGSVDMAFGGAPNLADVATGGGGLPGSPYAPNIASPTALGQNPADIPDSGREATLISKGKGSPFPSPEGTSAISPSITSRKVADKRIGNLIFGKSYVR
jgi:hypothetical protein